MNRNEAVYQSATILEARGIRKVATFYKWHASQFRGGWGWEYPIYSDPETLQIVATRWKAFNAEQAEIAGRKYAWLPSKPNDPDADWYILQSAKEAIEQAGGACYLANGEPSLLALATGGVFNAISTTMGEGAIPPDAISRLNSLGVYRLIYPFDNDDAGRKSASNWRDALAGSGIDFEAKTFEGLLDDKADVNDLWIEAMFSVKVFQSLLKGLPSGRLLDPPKKAEYGRFTGDVSNDQDLADAIASRFGLTGGRVNSKGFYAKKVNCPFHDDKRASAGIAADSGVLNCFSGCGIIDPLSVANAIGVDVSQYKQRKTENTKAPLSDKAQALEDCMDLIPKIQAVMTAQNRLLIGDEKIIPITLATLYIIRQSLLDGDNITIAQLSFIKTAKELVSP